MIGKVMEDMDQVTQGKQTKYESNETHETSEMRENGETLHSHVSRSMWHAPNNNVDTNSEQDISHGDF